MAKKTSKKRQEASLKKSPTKTKPMVNPTASKFKSSRGSSASAEPLLFGKQNYTIMIGGALLMALGFILMLGGHMPDANTWDENIIYGFRRTVAAPFFILAGLVTLIVAIFKKQPQTDQNL